MTTALVSNGWEVEVDRGPDCLFVRLIGLDNGFHGASDLAQMIWDLLEQHFAHRLVLEMDQVPILKSELLGQLVLLHKRVHANGGMMRLCGLSQANREVLRITGISARLPHYEDRESAVMGFLPGKPR